MTRVYFLLISIIVTQSAFCKNTDTAQNLSIPDSLKVLPKQVREIKVSLDTIKTKVVAISKVDDCERGCKPVIGGKKWVLVFAPFILFFVLGTTLTTMMIRGNLELSEAVSYANRVDNVKPLTAKGTAEIEIKKPIGSTSRLVAFFTGVTAIIVAVCLLSYYAYFTIAECKGTPPFEGLWKILLGLGIGVVPYGLNVWRGNSKETPQQNPAANAKPLHQ